MPEIFGVRIDVFADEQALLERLDRFLDGSRTAAIMTPNPEILLRARDDRAFAAVLRQADMLIPDGIGLSLVMRFRKHTPIRRYPGIDVGERLLERAERRRVPVMLLGGEHGSSIAAAKRLTEHRKTLRIFTAGDNIVMTEEGIAQLPEEEMRIAQLIHQTKPAIILVGLGSPKQERWIVRHRNEFPSVRIMITVGGAFDIWSGRFLRAPKALRVLGFEWLWRLIQQPSRFRRAARAVFVFPWRARSCSCP